MTDKQGSFYPMCADCSMPLLAKKAVTVVNKDNVMEPVVEAACIRCKRMYYVYKDNNVVRKFKKISQ